MKTTRKSTRTSKIVNQTKFVPTNTGNAFVSAMATADNVTLTEKGALTNKSTLNDCLDWFGLGGALRTRTEQDVINIFTRAYAQDRLTALRTLFYFRDVREGQGERETFRRVIKYLANNYSDVVRANLENIPFYGRYDDLYALVGTPLEAEMFELVKAQLKLDAKGMKEEKPISLLGKWLKSENTSSKESCRLGAKTRKALGLDSKKYRKMLSKLRAYIDVIERKMCAGKFSEIDFEKVPSKASLVYRKAFGRHDQTRYAAYLASVEKGEAKMNAKAVYPYEIFREVMNLGVAAYWYGSGRTLTAEEAQQVKMLTLQWNNMPNWLEGNEHKGIVIADVSGSMAGLPIQVSVSLAIYFAQRNVGPFKDVWMNFSDTPTFQHLKGSNLYEWFQNMDKNNWGGSTNLQSAFDLILRTAVANKVPKKDMPSVLYIVSDMEFDQGTPRNDKTNYQVIREKYKKAGYELPRIVWWNVSARNDQSPITAKDDGTCLVSGCSPSILKSILSAKSFTPVDVMNETINSARYERVVVE